MPAFIAWAVGWAVALLCLRNALDPARALAIGTAAAAALALFNAGRWRRLIAALGFPISALLMWGWGGGLASWAWLLVLLPLALLYPVRVWRDAPFFPTPTQALRGLDAVVMPAPRQVLDAGCGLGHGLAALRCVWPAATLLGVEWSAPMAWVAARRVRSARVVRGDMWAQPWTGLDLVYLFQRPESMARAWAKARAEMRTGAWLASLEFPVPGVEPQAALDNGVGRPLYVYRVHAVAGAQAANASTTAPARR